MVDEKRLRRKVLLKLISSPMTMIPLLAGVTTAAATWALNTQPGLGIFAGIAGVLVAGGTFMTRLLIGGQATAKEAIDELQQEHHLNREQALDDLDRRLLEDGDGRTESALRDLRTFAEAFNDEQLWSSGLNSRTTFDIMEGVDQLFRQCVGSLEQSLSLWHMAQKMNTKEARKPIVKQREHIIREVARSIEQLGKILVEIQSLESTDTVSSGLAHVREELDRSLEYARTIDEKMKQLGREFDTADYE